MSTSADLTPAFESLLGHCASASESVRTLLRPHHVVSMIIYGCSRSSGAGDDVDVKQGALLAEQTLQPAHEPYSHAPPSHATMLLPQPSGFSPSYIEVLAGVIVVRWSGKSRATFGRLCPFVGTLPYQSGLPEQLRGSATVPTIPTGITHIILWPVHLMSAYP